LKPVAYAYQAPFLGSPNRCASDWDYYGCEEIEWEILDRKGRRAPWLDRKLSPADRAAITRYLRSSPPPYAPGVTYEHLCPLATVTPIKPALVDAGALLAQGIQSGLSVDALERLLTMRRELQTEQARASFFGALSRFQAQIPAIPKTKSRGCPARRVITPTDTRTWRTFSAPLRRPWRTAG
jgi:hypothetical protein